MSDRRLLPELHAQPEPILAAEEVYERIQGLTVKAAHQPHHDTLLLDFGGGARLLVGVVDGSIAIAFVAPPHAS